MYNEKKEESNGNVVTYKKLKYSYNPQLTSNLSKADGGKITEGWNLSETNWNEQDLIDFVKTTSYLPSKLIDGKKIKKNVEEIYHKTIAEKFAFEKRLIVKELARYSIQSILTTPQNLSVNTINKYLELKARGLI